MEAHNNVYVNVYENQKLNEVNRSKIDVNLASTLDTRMNALRINHLAKNSVANAVIVETWTTM